MRELCHGLGASKSPASASTKKTMFFGSLELDLIKAKLQFSDVAEEVLMLFTKARSEAAHLR